MNPDLQAIVSVWFILPPALFECRMNRPISLFCDMSISQA
jgi:hypothetical protein